MDRKKVLQSLIFLAIGILLFWWVFRDTNVQKLGRELSKFSIFWILVSISINLMSQFIRALRWKLLFSPLNHTPRTSNLFLAILILGFTNQVIPRGGEVARLGIVNKYEKVTFPRLLGMAFAERLTDLVILLLIFGVILVWQFPMIEKLLALPEIEIKEFNATKILIIAGALIVLLTLIIFLIRKLNVFSKLREKIANLKQELSEGFATLMRIKNKFLFFFYTLLIYGLWLSMLYVMFPAYPPTESLSFGDAAFTFGLATLAFLVPVQAGMGAWHFVVIQCLLLLGIDTESGKAFALVAHAVTNLVYVPLGGIAFAILPLVNRGKENVSGASIHR